MIYLKLPNVPPSLNNVYTTVRKGKKTLRILTKEGRAYKEQTKAVLLQEYPLELAKITRNVPYVLLCRFHIRGMETAGYREGKAKGRYKRLDASNRVKVVEDVIAEVGAYDDAQHILSAAHKVQATGQEYTEVWIFNAESEECAVFNAVISL